MLGETVARIVEYGIRPAIGMKVELYMEPEMFDRLIQKIPQERQPRIREFGLMVHAYWGWVDVKPCPWVSSLEFRITKGRKL